MRAERVSGLLFLFGAGVALAVVGCEPGTAAPENVEVRTTYVVPMPDYDDDGAREGEWSDDDLVEEDDPRWDCRTMGNRTCGSVSA